MSVPELLIRGGTVCDVRGERRADVRIVGPTIAEVGPSLSAAPATTVVDAGGAVVLPAFVDLHTHLREPGGERAETVATGSRAAVLGGYRAVLAMPNTEPAIDSVEVVHHVRSLARDALCEVAVSGAITRGRRGDELAPFADLVRAGVRIFTDDGRGVQDDGLMREALRAASALGAVLAQHCEVESLARGAPMHEGAWSSRLGLDGQPASAEVDMVVRDLALCRETGAAIHFLHLSTADAVEAVRAAKAVGQRVTAEATPHHLALTDAEVCTFDPVFRVNPPLRPPGDVAAVRRGLADGTIDVVATDHAPHAPETKDEPFDCAPPGMVGLETAFAVVYSELVRRQNLRVDGASELSLVDLVSRFTTNPARIAGLQRPGEGTVATGSPADLVVFDTSPWRVGRTDLGGRSDNSPFVGMALAGRVRHTVIAGERVVIDARCVR